MKIFLVSHCILNIGSVVQGGDPQTELKRCFLKKALECGVQLIQVPCPEFLLYGHLRWGHTKEQFLTPAFVQKCRQISRDIRDEISEYRRFPDRFEMMGFVGIEGSPTCGVHKTCFGFKGGEISSSMPIPEAGKSDESGVLTEILHKTTQIPCFTLQEALSLLERIEN